MRASFVFRADGDKSAWGRRNSAAAGGGPLPAWVHHIEHGRIDDGRVGRLEAALEAISSGKEPVPAVRLQEKILVRLEELASETHEGFRALRVLLEVRLPAAAGQTRAKKKA